MKTQAISKAIAFASIIAGINMLSSCDSCNRKEESYDSTMETPTSTPVDTMTTVEGDTTAYDQADGSGTMTTTTTTRTTQSGSTAGSGTGRGETAPASTTETASTTSRVASGSGASAPAIDRENDPIENTSIPARKKGQAIDGGGTAGTGGGTGTGSTGNNSRVSKKTDQ